MKALRKLIAYKEYERYGSLLYADYEVLKPECSIAELVWGWCRNPGFAKSLISDLRRSIPDRINFPELLVDSNRDSSMHPDAIFTKFDDAMHVVVSYNNRRSVVYSTEGSDKRDCMYEDESGERFVQKLNATDEDGELWHGLMFDTNGRTQPSDIESIKVAIHSGALLLWKHIFTGNSLNKRIKDRNGCLVFQPFVHPMLLLDLDVTVAAEITYKPSATSVGGVSMLFGVCSNEFCDWLTKGSFEIALYKSSRAFIDMREKVMEFHDA